MPGATVVPLPVLVERVNLHPPPGVGHRAAQEPGRRPRQSRPGRGSGGGGSRGGRTPASEGVPGFTAVAGRSGAALPPAWPAPGPELWTPAFPRLWCLGAIVQARRARPPRVGRAALSSLSPRRGGYSGRRSLPCSRLRHDLREAASRAAAAASGRRRHVFLPYTWRCHRSRWLHSASLLQMSDADGRLLLLQLLPLRGRLQEPPGAERSWLLAVPFLCRCRRLFRLPHRAKAAAILVRPSIAARGATQAAAAGAARWSHHLKRQERGREPQCIESLRRRRLAGAELPRWRERRVRRRRNAGRTGDGPGLPRAPCTHCRASAGRCVRPSHPVFVISSAWGFGRGVEPACGRLCRPAPYPPRA